MTVGELALLFNKERKIGARLEVVPMRGWKRGDFYDATGLRWVNPSPNLRSLPSALTYPGIGILETTNLSVGRGTERPFEWIGAPWLDGRKMAAALTQESLPGVRFVPVNLTPNASTFKGQACNGVQIIVDDWKTFRPVHTGSAGRIPMAFTKPTHAPSARARGGQPEGPSGSLSHRRHGWR